jgi:hypothetical protein
VDPNPDFFVDPFAADGELVGVAGRSLSEFSPRWLDFCRRLLAGPGGAFHGDLPLPALRHIGLRFTSGAGAALISFTVHGAAASSAIALCGSNPAGEAEVLKSFVESLRRVPFVRDASAGPAPFGAAFALAQRPLYVMVPWPNPRVGDADRQLVQELENHLAAAFLIRPAAA